MAVGVNIVSTFDSQGISKAVKDFQKLQGAGNKATFALRTFDKGLTNTLKTVGKLAAGAAVAAGAIGYSLVKSAIQAQAEQDRLRQILLTTGAATDAQVKSLIAQAEALEKVGVASAGNIITAQSQLATFDLQFETIKKLTPAITDYVIAEKGASATAEDFKSMTNGLAQALNGQFGALTKAGFVLDEATKKLISNGTEGERAAAIVDVLSSTYGGFNEAIAKTPEGQLVQLKNSFESLRTELGTLLLPAFLTMVTFIQTQLIPYVQKLADVIGEKGLGAALGVLADDLLTTTTNMGTFGNVVLGLTSAFVALRLIAMAATISMTLFNVALFSNPIGIVVAAVIALGVALVALYLKFEIVRTVINTIALVLKTAFMNVIEAVYNAFAMLYNGFAQGINLLIKAANLFGANIPEIEMLGYRAFTVIGNAAEDAGKKIGASKKSIDAYGARLEGLAETFKKPSGTGFTGTVETAQQKLQKFTDKIQGVTKAQRSLKDATNSVENANNKLTDAFANTAKAQANFNKITKGYAADSKEVVAQSRSVADAQRSLVKANISAADSVTALKVAEEALKKLREKVSPFDLESGEIDLQKAKFDVEQANFAVLEAEKELADLRKDPKSTPQTIREAEIALAESKFGVRDAIKSVADAEEQLNKLRTDTPTLAQVADAERAVADAKLAVEDANLALADAQSSVNEEQEKLNELVNGATIGSDAYTDALKELTDAQKAEADAGRDRVDAYERLADATRDLAKAEKERRDAEKGLTPAERAKAEAEEAAAVNAGLVPELRAAEPAPAKYTSFLDAVKALHPKSSTLKSSTPVADSKEKFPKLFADYKAGTLVALAQGGIVTSPTAALIGEAGSEAVIPLDRLQSGMTINLTINAGMGTDPAKLGDEIVDVLTRYQRRNGALPLKVA
jgi:uncharacterized membrane protein YeaQ/YmgE (transglycosylase-associated protein family)